MTRALRIIRIIFIPASLIFLLSGCGLGAAESRATQEQPVTVQRGNLEVDITAVGNLALSRTEELAFEMAGTVEEVLVGEGDSVSKGQELVRLDTSEWDKQLRTLEKALATAERTLTTKERDLARAERQVTTKELAVRQAELDVQSAEYNLGQIADVKAAQEAVDEAEIQLKIARAMLEAGSDLGAGYWIDRIAISENLLDAAQRKLQRILDGSSATVTGDVALKVAKTHLQVEQSQRQLEDAGIAVEDARLAVADARLSRDDAGQDANDARSALDEARGFSPVIKAPFDGFITKVNVEGGDEIQKGTVAVQLADPNKFEAEILVSERDIPQVSLGGRATVGVDALPGMSLPAEVTHISPTATISQGVVNYKVKVTLQPIEEIARQRQVSPPAVATGNATQGELPERLQQSVAAGRITPEQAEEMMRQFPQGMGRQPGTSGQTGQEVPALSLADFHLREGLTVMVSIIVEQRNNVLLVPNAAITTQGRQTIVQVLGADGTREQRTIETGISDYQFTEVTGGLSEGEQIIVPQGTATTPTTQTRQGQQGGMFVPGMRIR
ncbi:MAG: HlyD family efflux transporter periplasmic adaptor subunit [Dehalococcoidales bacterium]|nr:HlyD family efflux transporter periplasmic adaptor subunit [Dehalococcoidales bacterium]